MEFAPSRILEKAVEEEIEANLNNAMRAVNESKIPLLSNILSSDFVFKIKENEEGIENLKARLCPHDSRDKDKDLARKNFANARHQAYEFC